MSESKVGETFNRLFQSLSDNRIIIATFASNVHRVQQIINLQKSMEERLYYLVGPW